MSSGTHHVLTQAIRAHWHAHEGKYPQKIVLTPAQHEDLIRLVTIGRAGRPPVDPFEFMGCKLERGEAGVLVSADGTEVPLDL